MHERTLHGFIRLRQGASYSYSDPHRRSLNPSRLMPVAITKANKPFSFCYGPDRLAISDPRERQGLWSGTEESRIARIFADNVWAENGFVINSTPSSNRP